MRQIAKKLLFISLTLQLAACAGTAGRPAALSVPDPASPAAQAYVARCGICHAVPHPARHAYSGWLHLVPLMEQRMAERGVTAMSGEEKALIMAYLKEHAR